MSGLESVIRAVQLGGRGEGGLPLPPITPKMTNHVPHQIEVGGAKFGAIGAVLKIGKVWARGAQNSAPLTPF